MQQIEITLNGDRRTIDEGCTVDQLVQRLASSRGPVAVELNEEIVSREQWAGQRLQAGDRVEIVHFVGGGARDS